ncbi:hypothetical protein, partial [Streptomyces parvus]|uniref:hypothetical protein n=1 Tax=Streptomyces parvus TaxID=66428 RepID=UPI0033CF5D70
MKPSPHPSSGPERPAPAPGLPALPGRRGFLGGLLATAAAHRGHDHRARGRTVHTGAGRAV